MRRKRNGHSEVAARIREARRERGLTQADLARHLGVPLGLIERLESGVGDADRYVDAIAEATTTSVDWLRHGHTDDAIAALMQRVVELIQRVEDLDLRVSELEHERYSQAKPKPKPRAHSRPQRARK